MKSEVSRTIFTLLFPAFALAGVIIFTLFLIGSGSREKNLQSISLIKDELSLAGELTLEIHKQNYNIRSFVYLGDEDYINEIAKSRARMRSVLSRLNISITSGKILQQLGTIRLMVDQYNRTADSIIAVRREKGREAALNYLTYGSLMENAEEEIKILNDMTLLHVNSGVEHDTSVLSMIQWIFITLFVVIIAVSYVISFRLKSIIVNPLARLVDGARHIARGEYEYRVDVTPGNEFAEVGEAFNTMAVSVKESIEQLKDSKMRIEENLEELQLANQKIEQSEKTYREFTNLLPQIVYEFNKEQFLTYFNKYGYTITGYTLNDMLQGLNVMDLIDPAYYSIFESNMQRLFNGETIFGTEYLLIKKNGERFPALLFSSPYFNGEELAGVRGIAIDITEQKKAEESREKLERQLRQAQKMEAIGTLSGGIAHDFNNILGAIMGFTELTILDCGDNEEVLNKLEEVMKASRRAKELVEQILLFSRQTEHEKCAIEPRLVIIEALKLLRASIPTTIEFKTDLRSSSLIMADPTQLHQVIMNLCTNAAYAMKDGGGVLTLCIENTVINDLHHPGNHDLPHGAYLKLSVSDTGTGIPQNILERIFDPFFTTKPQGEGTGMGLSMVIGIVKSCGGDVTVYSEEGKGTVFNLYFPITEYDFNTEGKSCQSISLKRGNGETVLWVDDEKSLVELGIAMLGTLGFSFKGFTDSRAALEEILINPDRYTIVITDKTMPHMNGFEFVEKMRKNNIDIPVIMCTGYGDISSIENAKQSGIEEVVMKPYNINMISSAIWRIIDRQKGKPGD